MLFKIGGLIVATQGIIQDEGFFGHILPGDHQLAEGSDKPGQAMPQGWDLVLSL